MSRYHVAVVAPPWYPVPPVGYGGTELVVDLLVRELRRRGVEVTLFAAEGSAHGAIIAAPAEWCADLGGTWHEHREVTYVGRVLDMIEELQPDLIHDHAGFASPLVFSQSMIPTLHTVHGPVGPDYDATTAAYEAVGQRARLAAISAAQRDSAPHLNWSGVVHNAVDIESLHIGDASTKNGYLLCLARISPDKGQHVAIDVARRSGRRLVLAGKVGEKEEERAYFKEVIEPQIDGVHVTYLHNIVGDHKHEVIARAGAMLAPLHWPEPFGLAMAEAMASGTPCIAMGRGAAPELIEEGVTGFLCEDADCMVDAVEKAEALDPLVCASRARERFSPAAMTDGYVGLYEAIVAAAADAWPAADPAEAIEATEATVELPGEPEPEWAASAY